MLTMMFLLIVAVLGFGFDWHNQSTAETRSRNDPKVYRK
jgi:hypothetical protein